MDKQIRFIDSHFNELFTVPDGGNVVVTHFDGKKEILPCEYIDKRLVRIGGIVFHIREFAEEQERNGTIYAPENGHCDSYEIYQIEDVRGTDYYFRSLAEAGERFNRADYEKMYVGMLASNMTLEYLYAKHNMDNRPFGRKMRSLSMSDVIVLKRGGKKTAFYVDTFGFEEVPQFIKQELPMPEICYSTIPSTGELVMIKHGERGYFRCEHSKDDTKWNRDFADDRNIKLGVTKAQEAAMLAGSMFGWNIPAADPRHYDEKGNPVKPKKNKDYER